MFKWFVYLYLLFSATLVMAHQPDVSSTLLIERPNNNWILQVRASLTAFQSEIQWKQSKNDYATPEEFQELVLSHMKEHLLISFNGIDTVTFQNGYVKLGHETSVVFEVLGVPETIDDVCIKNSSFQNIKNNQSALVILKEGFSKEQFILTNKNQHTVNLKADGSKFVQLKGAINASSTIPPYLNIGLILFAIGIIGYFWIRPKKVNVSFV